MTTTATTDTAAEIRGPSGSPCCNALHKLTTIPHMPVEQFEPEPDPTLGETDILELYLRELAEQLSGVSPGYLIENEGYFPQEGPLLNVARSVGKAEIKQQPKAEEACAKEWERLQAGHTWDVESVREWRDVKREATARGETIHVGSLHELCTEKGSELPDGDLGKKYKGRVVFLGDRVKDQHGKVAIFEEMTSNPATMEAAKIIDFFGCLDGKLPVDEDEPEDAAPSTRGTPGPTDNAATP